MLGADHLLAIRPVGPLLIDLAAAVGWPCGVIHSRLLVDATLLWVGRTFANIITLCHSWSSSLLAPGMFRSYFTVIDREVTYKRSLYPLALTQLEYEERVVRNMPYA